MSAANNQILTPTGTEVVDLSIDNKHNSVSSSDGTMPDDDPSTKALLELRPLDIDYSPKDDHEIEEIRDLSPSELKDLMKTYPSIYDFIPECVWQAMTTGEKGLKKVDDLDRLYSIWGERLEDFKQHHKESFGVVQVAYPNLYSQASKVARLDYETMRKRFSQDGGSSTNACVGVTLVERMRDLLIKKLPVSQQKLVELDGDLITTRVVPDDDSDDGCTPGGEDIVDGGLPINPSPSTKPSRSLSVWSKHSGVTTLSSSSRSPTPEHPGSFG